MAHRLQSTGLVESAGLVVAHGLSCSAVSFVDFLMMPILTGVR